MEAAPLAVAVLDESGQMKSFQREDETSLMRADVATGKAWGALGTVSYTPLTLPTSDLV